MKNFKKNYPLDPSTPFKNFKESLEIAVRETPDTAAFKYFEKGEIVEKTYKTFKRDTEAFGTALASIGIVNLHVAIIGESSYNWIVAYMSMLNGEGVFVPIDKELPADEVANIVIRSDSEAIIFSGKYDEKIREQLDRYEHIKYFIGIDLEEDDGRFLSFKKLFVRGYELLEGGDRSFLDLQPKYEELKLLVYTSGTTGAAKGVMLSLKNLVSCVYHGLRIAFVKGTCLSVLPYHHTYESVCGILVSLHVHNTICINENLRAVARNLKAFKPDYVFMVPLFVESLYKKIWANAEDTGKAPMLRVLMKVSNGLLKVGIDMRRTLFKTIHDMFGGNLIKIVCGGAPLRKELADFYETIGIKLLNGYGISECSPLVSVNREFFYDSVSVGVTLPCIEVIIDNPNEDGEGEICVKGDTVMLGYYKQPELTDEVLSEDGWFKTGDYGRFDEAGKLYITGRKKNLIVLKNGKNIYPEEIEDYVISTNIAAEVIVSAVRNEQGEEIGLNAEVYPIDDILKNNSEEQALEIVKKAIDELNSKLPSYKQITRVAIRNTPFDKTTTGKIRRNYAK